MASPAFPFPASTHNTYTGAGPNTPSEASLADKLQEYIPDVYNSSPTVQSAPGYPPQRARFPGRTSYSRPESPASIGRSTSGWSVPQVPELAPPNPAHFGRSTPVWPAPQAPESLNPVQKTYKTFLQWKADAQAMTAEYQRDGFPSPFAWVLFSHSSPPSLFTYYVGIRRGPRHPPKRHHWWCGPQGFMAHCPCILRGEISAFLAP
jgi:hypothetical protein